MVVSVGRRLLDDRDYGTPSPCRSTQSGARMRLLEAGEAAGAPLVAEVSRFREVAVTLLSTRNVYCCNGLARAMFGATLEAASQLGLRKKGISPHEEVVARSGLLVFDVVFRRRGSLNRAGGAALPLLQPIARDEHVQ